MNRLPYTFAVLALALAGCRTTPPRGGGAELKAGPSGIGPTQTRPTWIKSPESIEGTITSAWGLQVSEAERWKYLQSIYSMLGGTQVLSSKSLVDQPNELFALGLDNLSGWLSGRLVDKETALEAEAKEHSFDGLSLSDEDAGCFADDGKDWCDLKDGVRLDSLAKAGVDPKAPLSKEWKKRLMHNVQDIGEFMLLAIDNTLKMPGGQRHAADYLVSEVFVPSFPGGAPATVEQEKTAWKNVIYTILMSGGFYLEAPPQTNEGEP